MFNVKPFFEGFTLARLFDNVLLYILLYVSMS